eukprot:766721_1
MAVAVAPPISVKKSFQNNQLRNNSNLLWLYENSTEVQSVKVTSTHLIYAGGTIGHDVKVKFERQCQTYSDPQEIEVEVSFNRIKKFVKLCILLLGASVE